MHIQQFCTAAADMQPPLHITVCVGVYAQHHVILHLPALVRLLCSVPKYIWEAVSHELGHSLGLNHDNILGSNGMSQYYAGQGDWASVSAG
jgi:hypothetical protein